MTSPSLEFHLALSGDTPDEEASLWAAGVGLIRAEYVLRQSGHYATTLEGSGALTEYSRRMAKLHMPRPVWVRTSDFEAREISTLVGCDADIVDENPILGDRGIRRAQCFPGALRCEIDAAVRAAEGLSNLGLLFSYVPDVDALDFALGAAKAAGWRGPIGTMIETPSAALSVGSFLIRDLDLLVVGMNDLTSLTLGAARNSSYHRKDDSAVLDLVVGIATKARAAGCKILVAGNFKPLELEAIRHLPVDGVILHYYELPVLMPERFGKLGNLDVVPRIKAETARLLKARSL